MLKVRIHQQILRPAGDRSHATLVHTETNSNQIRLHRTPCIFDQSCFIAAMVIVFAPATLRTGIALEPTTPLAEYGRQSWVMENGLPQNSVHALVQTHDGFLWVGTEAGLVRFDGSGLAVYDTTSKPALPSGDIRALLETRDGALWIGTGDGLARWKDSAVTTFTTANGLPANGIRALSEDPSGVVIVSSVTGEVEIQGETIVPAHADHPEAADSAPSPVLSSSIPGGHLQATNSTVLFTRGKKEMRWSVGHELPGTRIEALYADRAGCLWIGTNGGLVRLANDKVEKFPLTDPLATASVLSILEDREGNLWVGTELSGLHILRDQRFRVLTARNGLASDNTTTVVEDGTFTLWVGSGDSGLSALRRNGNTFTSKTYSVHDGLLSNVVLSLAAASNGDLWVGTPDGLNLIRPRSVRSFTAGDGLPDDFVRSLLVDGDGSLWIGTRRGLTHWIDAPDGGRMQTFTQASGLGNDLVGAMARDSRGNLWVATLAGLSRLQANKITNYTTANGLSSNVITSLLPRGNGMMLIGTQDHGWNLWDGEKFAAARGSGLDQTSVHAILDDRENHLWFATGKGIARCDCTTALDCSQWIEFGPADGLRSRETATNSHPSAWHSRDRHLWFATAKGLVEVDPAHFPVNALPPPVAIERFAVDDLDQPMRGVNLSIPAGHAHFQFDYAGLSFIAPQKVRYRYMLEGFDRDWTDAGPRRMAYYTNIPPGHYAFRVQATNNDGLWNRAGASLQFDLRPHFYQTVWFYILLALFGAGLVALGLKLRLLRAEREFGAVLKERTRIAREIHDTLAQGYVGVSVQLEVLAELLRHDQVDAATKQLDVTRDHVREGLADARQSIWALRSQDTGEQTLPIQLRRLTEQADAHGLEAEFTIHGAYRPLSPGTEREIIRVAQEAIHNVKKHADAKNLQVRLDYAPAEIALEVRDDGRGFETNQNPVVHPGHYGFTGMRERAKAIGGRLEITSKPGAGTAVRLHAPTPNRETEA